jgi:hypothetical protein
VLYFLSFFIFFAVLGIELGLRLPRQAHLEESLAHSGAQSEVSGINGEVEPGYVNVRRAGYSLKVF